MEEIPTNEFKLKENLNLRSEFTPPTFTEWKTKVEKDLNSALYEKKLVTKTYEGINLSPIYTLSDIEHSPFTQSFPGGDNFVRGNSVSGYKKNKWDLNQEINVSDIDEYNTALQEALNNGQNCINVLLDSATKLGLDADDAETILVGDQGLSISTLNSLQRAFKKIDLKKYPIYLDCGFNSMPMLSLINAFFKENKIDITNLDGAVTVDPLGHLAYYGELPVSRKPIFDMMKNSVYWANDSISKLRTVGISTLSYLNAGANSVQELSYAISTLVNYLNELADRNIEPSMAINKVQFSFGISTNYFMEIAKFRAARVLISNIALNYGIDTKTLKFNIGAKSSYYNQTNLDPYVNLLRSTTESFSAILGGADYITTSPFDETLRIPDSFSRRIARNTQTILREESHLDQVIDPVGGSFYVESLTEKLANQAWSLFKKIENNGGMYESLAKGIIQNSIAEVAIARKNDIDKRKSVIVGTNMFVDINESKLDERIINQTSFQKKRAENLKKFRFNGRTKNLDLFIQKLRKFSTSASADIIDKLTETFLLGATIGEISSAVTPINKEKVEIQKLLSRRASQDFEDIRQKAIDYQEQYGAAPNVFLVNYGTLKEYKGRADFSKSFFEVGGFDVITKKNSLSVDEAVNSALASKAPIVVICSTDDNYKQIAIPISKKIKRNNSNIQIIIAGYPKDQIDEYKKSGVDDFIFLGADVRKKLESYINKIWETK